MILIWTNFTPCNLDSNIRELAPQGNIVLVSMGEITPCDKLVPFLLREKINLENFYLQFFNHNF
jgi:hypothetical protein